MLYFDAVLFTEEILHDLLVCEKLVVSGWRDIKDARHGVKKVMELRSVDDSYWFVVFYTQNVFFKESFSIGIVYLTNTDMGKIVLLRCNGKHGGEGAPAHHSFTHIHRPTADELNKGNKQPWLIEKADGYSTLETAIPYFGKLINVNTEDRARYFPAPPVVNQMELSK